LHRTEKESENLRKRQEKGKHVAQYSRRPVTRETTKSNSISESVFKGTYVVYDDRDDLFAEPEKLQEILCFLPVLVFILKRGFRTAGDEFVETKEVFVGNIPLHKNLSRFLHNYHSLRDSDISLRPIFQRFHNKLFLVLVTNFGQGCRTAGDEFLETKKRFFLGTWAPSQKPLSFLHNYHILRDSNLSLRPIFLRFHNK
jgi:hypothetical protein